ncbi:ABC transporter [Colletotrichum scovillei]|uniref:ABC transporter n=1 Tax=Colletotrichum scovillei TaxID=1209932 RepID=A0A9P7UAP8_9PEZI|nr:ABC transporter [Colletotrichum scovillei]KAG7059935.1 ABC transporter [Colletotrichum scovillei]KAG7067383.1 ABC transporter [Colletotrichum scovillei]
MGGDGYTAMRYSTDKVVCILNSLKPVRNRDDGARSQLIPQHLLHPSRRLLINRRGSLVQHHNRTPTEDGPANPDELSLSLAQVLPAALDVGV